MNFLYKIFNSGIEYCRDNHSRRTVLLINRMSVIISCIMFLFSIFAFFQENFDVLPFSIVFFILFSLPPLFHSFGYIIFTRYCFSILPPILSAVVSVTNGKQGGDIYYILSTALIPLMLFVDKRPVYIIFIFNVLVFYTAIYLQNTINPVVYMSENIINQYYLINMFSIFLILFFVISYYRKGNENYEKELMHQKEIIQEKNKEIIDSISYAKRIQEAYLPPEFLFYKIFKDAFVLYKPKDIVSGDFYWFYSPEKKKVFLAVADCTGHGVPGALMSVICCNALNEAAVNNKITSPAKILDATRQTVKTSLKSNDNSGQKDGMDISLSYLDYTEYEKKQTINLNWSGANNPLWIYRDSTKQIEEYKGDKQPIGFHANEKPFTNIELKLYKGDVIYLMSDGFADQFGGEKGKKFKYSNLQKLLLHHSNKSMATLRNELINAFENWKGDLEQVDDVCIIGVRI